MDASGLFDDQAMAEGYAHDRPPVHAHVVERLRAGPAFPAKVRTVVDVRCGGGASTTALLGLGETVLGVDPAVPMVRAARRAEPDGRFVVAEAEALPCLVQSVDLLAASGTLGFVDLGAFVLMPIVSSPTMGGLQYRTTRSVAPKSVRPVTSPTGSRRVGLVPVCSPSMPGPLCRHRSVWSWTSGSWSRCP